MAEYIEREALQAALVRKRCGVANQRYTEGWNDCLLRVKSMVSKAPAADVAQVVHGRWTAQCVVELDGGWTLEDVPYNEYQHSNPICSVCRKTALLDGGEDYVTSPYCPNCGAKMDGGVE